MGSWLFAATLFLHLDSVSNSTLVVEGERVGVVVRCQVYSLMEVLPALDADLNGEVSAAEIEANADAILDYIGRHYELSIGSDRAFEGGRMLDPEPISATHVVWEDAPGRFKDWVDVELHFAAGERVRDVGIESSLFLSTSPGHRDVLTIEWPELAAEHHSLDALQPCVRSDPEGRGAFAAFARIGVERLRTRWDVVIFALALALVAERRRSVIGLSAWIGALTVGLALGASCGESFERYVRVLDAAAVLSIAYIATDHLLLRPRERHGWFEPALFGIVSGLGLGTTLIGPLFSERAPVHAWLGFAAIVVGAAAGLGVLALALFGSLSRTAASESDYVAPRWIRRAGAVVLALVGFTLFFQRI